MIVGWSSYGHIQHRAARIALLRALHAGCTDGAPLMLSFHARDGMRYPFEIVSRTANVSSRVAASGKFFANHSRNADARTRDASSGLTTCCYVAVWS